VSGLAGAFIGQIAALLLSLFVASLFLYDPKTKELKPGTIYTLLQFPPLWFGLLLGVVVAAQSRQETVRAFAILKFRFLDAMWLFVGVVLQFAAVLIYLPFNVDTKELEAPARKLVADVGGIGWGFAVLSILVALVAPFVEELFYRGLLTRSLIRAFQRVPGLSNRRLALLSTVISALWFAAIHGQKAQFPALFVVGVVCALTTLWVGRLWPSIFIHVGFNATTIVALYFRTRNG
jgi:uncharacterized protein